ncbi:MAG: hypothetical protein MJE68_30460 [Proteobacteria bacterium]|nr:hypothetical protein [Pseudomonadota bacterium]
MFEVWCFGIITPPYTPPRPPKQIKTPPSLLCWLAGCLATISILSFCRMRGMLGEKWQHST